MKHALAAVLCLAACAAPTSEGALRYETPAQLEARRFAEETARRMVSAEEALARGDLDAADTLYRDVANRDPEAIGPRLRLAALAQKRHLHGEAERWLREVVALEPDRMEVRYQLVGVLLRQRRVADAREEFQRLQQLGFADEVAELRLKAAIALRSGQLVQAARLYDQLLERNPRDAAGHMGLGVVLALAGDIDEALHELETARRLAPDSATAHYDLALVYYRKGHLEAALASGREAVRLDGWFLPARLNLAAALVKADRAADARLQLEEAIRLRPTYAPAHNNLGVVLMNGGDLGGAIEHLGEAVHHAPRVAAFHFNLGIARFRSGDLPGARKAFEQVLRLDPANAGATRNLRWLDGVEQGTLRGTSLPVMSQAVAVDDYEG